MSDKKVKIIAMYLPQYHEIPENSEFWGKGFTDWVSVKKAVPVFEGHKQPRIPLNNNYYDLSKKDTLKWQADMAKEYGIYGFGIYHYWFSSQKQLLTKPAEIILENPDIDIPFFFAWDNGSWKRTWSKLKGNDWAPTMDTPSREKSGPEILVKYELGGKEEWEKHFDYLLPYFKDSRYICIDNKPVFVIYNYENNLLNMAKCWNNMAIQNGFNGVAIIYKYDPIRKIPVDSLKFLYEPQHSWWNGYFGRAINKAFNLIGIEKVKIYSYDALWKKILRNARKKADRNFVFGAYVNFDDTPRRGIKGRITTGSSSEKFGKYMEALIDICMEQKKEYIFLTAWNEWGEGAYLEPDSENKYAYLESIKEALIKTNNF